MSSKAAPRYAGSVPLHWKVERGTTIWGRLPHLVRAGEAKVELKLQCQLPIADNSFRVFALGTDGRRECEVPSDWSPTAGILRFTASVRQPFGACLYYEIVRDSLP